jgi:membrane protein implicated in regulation of membrane protease activity
MSDDGSEIPTGTRVVVVRVVKGNTMVVKRV